jgi:membrane-associated protein
MSFADQQSIPTMLRMEILNYIFDLLLLAIDFITNMPPYLESMSTSLGVWMYVILFLIVFCETGLVVTPFLPGDSLLFAVGALCALSASGLNLWWMAATLIVAANSGDAVNYSVGKYLAPRIFKNTNSKIFNPEHLRKTEMFYAKHGGKTIVLARFIPIIRTYAPFVAGLTRMRYKLFWVYSVSGAVLWVVSFLSLGYFFGNLPTVKDNFHIVIIAIILISVAPAAFEYVKARRTKEGT